MEIISNYQKDDRLRGSFNDLAGKVFGGLSFEGWYRNGFWTDNYVPYSVLIDGKIVSNVSVNRCDMNYEGKTVHLLQLGTVMTDPAHRGKGYSKALMERILSDYEGKTDGIYLYANDSVTGFYPRFGFVEKKEYQYAKAVEQRSKKTAVPVPMKTISDWDKMAGILDQTEQNGRLYMVSNSGLYMFYLSQFMQENTFFIPECQTYAIAESEDGTLILHAVIGQGNPDQVIAAFGKDVKNVVLDFTPKSTEGWTRNEVFEEDTHLFVRGKFFEETAGEFYMFQAITHA